MTILPAVISSAPCDEQNDRGADSCSEVSIQTQLLKAYCSIHVTILLKISFIPYAVQNYKMSTDSLYIFADEFV